MMKDVVIVGAGKIGSMIAEFLGSSGDYAVTVVDRSQQQLDRLETSAPIKRAALDITQGEGLRKLLAGKFAVLSAAPYHATRLIAEAAKAGGAHYLDLTEDVASTRAVKQLGVGARTAFIPQCGLAPGFITIVASDLASRFDELNDVRMRVGALPEFPSNALNYNLTWSTDGVINEYCEPCEAIVNGQLRETQPLEELEEFSLDGILYEAFNTSGGLGTLCETLAGKVRNLNYRTIRYPGHAAIMKALLNDLRLRVMRHYHRHMSCPCDHWIRSIGLTLSRCAWMRMDIADNREPSLAANRPKLCESLTMKNTNTGAVCIRIELVVIHDISYSQATIRFIPKQKRSCLMTSFASQFAIFTKRLKQSPLL